MPHARPSVLIASLVLVTAVPAAGHELSTSREAAIGVSATLSRFVQVDARLYRGEEPDSVELEALQRLGVRTVISLRTDTAARARVEALGMRFVHIPIPLRPLTFGVAVNRTTIEEFFRVVDDPANGIVYVHCRRGADRTGTLIGLYRIARQHWAAADAYREARGLGMRWWLFRVEDLFERFAAQPV